MRSPCKQFVISIDELWSGLQKYEPLLAFAEDGLHGVIQSFLSLDRQDYSGAEYGFHHGSWIDYSAEQVMGDLSWQFDNLSRYNACPLRTKDIDFNTLELIVIDIAEQIDALYQQYFPHTRYVVRDVKRLTGKTTYCVIVEIFR